MVSTVALFVVVFLIVFLIYGEASRRHAEKIYCKIDNDNDVAAAKQYVSYARPSKPIDYYRLGSVFDHMLRDKARAHRLYKQAVRGGDEFVEMRIRDRLELNRRPEVDDHVLDEFIVNDLVATIEAQHRAAAAQLKPPSKPSKIEDKIRWEIDADNVHDSAMTEDIVKGFNRIMMDSPYNATTRARMPEIINYVENSFKKESAEHHNVAGAVRMLNIIARDDRPIAALGGVRQSEFLGEVFGRIRRTEDETARRTMMENLVLNLKDCVGEDDSPVCIPGRIARIMSSFTDIDANMGMLRSKPAIRNQLLSDAAAIRNRLIDAAPQAVQDKYNAGDEDDAVLMLEESIREETNKMLSTADAPVDVVEGVRADIDASIGGMLPP